MIVEEPSGGVSALYKRASITFPRTGHQALPRESYRRAVALALGMRTCVRVPVTHCLLRQPVYEFNLVLVVLLSGESVPIRWRLRAVKTSLRCSASPTMGPRLIDVDGEPDGRDEHACSPYGSRGCCSRRRGGALVCAEVVIVVKLTGARGNTGDGAVAGIGSVVVVHVLLCI